MQCYTKRSSSVCFVVCLHTTPYTVFGIGGILQQICIHILFFVENRPKILKYLFLLIIQQSDIGTLYGEHLSNVSEDPVSIINTEY